MNERSTLIESVPEGEDPQLVTPWHCGSQLADWLDRNCERCVKYEPEGAPAACELDLLGVMPTMMGESIPKEIAERLGYVEDGFPSTWDCPERVLNAKEASRER